MEDLRSQAQVRMISKNGNGHTPQLDDMDQTLQTIRKVSAAQMLQKTVNDLGTAATQAEIEKLRAEIEKDKLLAEAKAPAQQTDIQALLMGQIEKLQGQVYEAQKTLSEQQAAFLQSRLDQMTAQIQALQENKPEPVNAMLATKQSLQEAMELADMVRPQAAPAPEPIANTADATRLHAWTLSKQLEHERWKIERADRSAESQAKLDLDREVRLKELEIKAQEQEQKDRFFSQTAPKALEIGEGLLKQWIQATQQLPVQAAPMAAPRPQVAPPQGTETVTCEKCHGTAFYFAPKSGALICQTCGDSYQVSGSPDPEPGPSPQSPSNQSSGTAIEGVLQ